MYFFTEGIIGVGFTLVSKPNGMKNSSHSIAKKLVAGPNQQTIVCDHYVVNDCKSQFIYITISKETKGFALTKEFLHKTVFPKYPEIKARI